MRVQYTNDESKMIEKYRTSGNPGEETYIYPQMAGKTITVGLYINDPYKFDMFLKNFLKDESIRDQIGAGIIHLDMAPPIQRAELFKLKNDIDKLNNICDKLILGENNPDDEDDGDYGEETDVSDEGDNS